MKRLYVKKCLVSLCVLFFICSGLLSCVSFADSVTIGDVTYDYHMIDEELVLYRVTCKSSITKLEVPAKLDGKCVTKIMGYRDKSDSFGAFQDLKDLEEVVISDGIDTIGTNAFRNCVKLNSVVMPPSVRLIDICAFMNCESLRVVYLPRSVERIKYNAFAECTSLEKVYACFGTTFDAGALYDKTQISWY